MNKALSATKSKQAPAWLVILTVLLPVVAFSAQDSSSSTDPVDERPACDDPELANEPPCVQGGPGVSPPGPGTPASPVAPGPGAPASPAPGAPGQPDEPGSPQPPGPSDCPDAPRSGLWKVSAGQMTVDGVFTPLGGGEANVKVRVLDCGARITADFPGVGHLVFQPDSATRCSPSTSDKSRHYNATTLPSSFQGVLWVLDYQSPTQMISETCFHEPRMHQQWHRWTLVKHSQGP